MNEINTTEVGNLLDALVAHGATLMTNTQLINWVAQQSQTGTSTYYWAAATGLDADMRPTKASPVVNVGTDLGTGFALDLEGVDQRVFGSGWEMGAYHLRSRQPLQIRIDPKTSDVLNVHSPRVHILRPQVYRESPPRAHITRGRRIPLRTL